MSSDQSDPTNSHALTVSHSTGLVKLPDGSSSALSEIISRSLIHIQTGRDLVVPARKAGEECEFEIAPGVKIVMCWIPPGEFLMGSPEDGEKRHGNETQHLVKITQGFWLAKTQTTQAQWQAVTGFDPSYLNMQGGDLPVEHVSWNDICGDEAGSEGFLGAVNRMRSGGEYFHLPTEAQWEYACRAGTVGAHAEDLEEIAWCFWNSGGKLHPVGQKKANDWGLHDMLENVHEWCSDWIEYYDGCAETNPVGPASGLYRVARGGSRVGTADDCRAASRHGMNPDYAIKTYGFRLARSSVPITARGGADETQQRSEGRAEWRRTGSETLMSKANEI